ncbi:DUF3173 family protein [Enterococcus wangshanyuanii]|uniref:DUF3173 domain-containing protein n=1 Tax=Enterococcus wangshanyuanii TaxID=2005703 RepID=A0ABQ1PCT9_9ENTE|nr:DUF3173 family protein [Enterococcus wangshanyuanii]GGC94708.1 hypothetical protein GCM10011573_25430 [Enterococcus wangshanyuanii]
MNTVTKYDIMKLGFTLTQSQRIMKEAKALLVQQGCLFYAGKKVSRVPKHTVEKMLDLKFEKEVVNLG